MGVPNAAVTLFDTLKPAQGGSLSDSDDASRRTWATDLVTALSAFPSLPPGAIQYTKAELKGLLPSVDQLEARLGIRQALCKIEDIFSNG
jgi:hypothetical protein